MAKRAKDAKRELAWRSALVMRSVHWR